MGSRVRQRDHMLLIVRARACGCDRLGIPTIRQIWAWERFHYHMQKQKEMVHLWSGQVSSLREGTSTNSLPPKRACVHFNCYFRYHPADAADHSAARSNDP